MEQEEASQAPHNMFENLVRMMLRQQLFASGMRQGEEGPQPAAQQKIESLEKRHAEGGEDKCPVCFSDYEKDEELTVLPCSHTFHTGCVTEWLKRHNSCPCCRQAI